MTLLDLESFDFEDSEGCDVEVTDGECCEMGVTVVLVLEAVSASEGFAGSGTSRCVGISGHVSWDTPCSFRMRDVIAYMR